MKRPWQFFRCHHLRMAYGLAGLTALFFSYLFMLNGVHHQFTPRWGAYRFLRLFTNQTNLMVVAWSLISCLKVPDEQAGVSLPKGLRGALAAYITLTMVLFHFYLRQGYWLTPPLFLVSLVTHYVVPLAFLVDWRLTEPRGSYQWRHLTYWLFYPGAYWLTAMVIGSLTGAYPYPFLDWQQQGIVPVILKSGGIGVAVTLLAAAIINLNQRQSSK